MGRKLLRRNKWAGMGRNEEHGWPKCASPYPVHLQASLGATIFRGSQNCTQTSPRMSRTWGPRVCISRVYISWAVSTHLPCPFYSNRLYTGIFSYEKATITIGHMSKQGTYLKSASCPGSRAVSAGKLHFLNLIPSGPFLVGCSSHWPGVWQVTNACSESRLLADVTPGIGHSPRRAFWHFTWHSIKHAKHWFRRNEFSHL